MRITGRDVGCIGLGCLIAAILLTIGGLIEPAMPTQPSDASTWTLVATRADTRIYRVETTDGACFYSAQQGHIVIDIEPCAAGGGHEDLFRHE